MDVFLALSMTQILAVNPHKLIAQVAKELEQESAISQPEWSKFVKTGHHKQRLYKTTGGMFDQLQSYVLLLVSAL